MDLLSTGILGSTGLSDYEEKCCPSKEEQLTFDFDSPVDALCEGRLSGLTYDLQCDGVSVEEGLNILDRVQSSTLPLDSFKSLPSPSSSSDCSWDSGLPGSAEEQFLAGLFGTDVSLHSQTTYSPTPSPTNHSSFAYSEKSNSGVKLKKMTEVEEYDHQGDRSRGGKVSESVAQKNRKNAEAARQNRLKKKRYVEDLEKNHAALKTENVVLKAKCHEYQTRCQKLQSEVMYLRSVLANDSALASLLENIPNVPKVKLTSSLGKRHSTNTELPPKKMKRLETTGGVCLHVAKDSVSLEFCANCSKIAT